MIEFLQTKHDLASPDIGFLLKWNLQPKDIKILLSYYVLYIYVMYITYINIYIYIYIMMQIKSVDLFK